MHNISKINKLLILNINISIFNINIYLKNLIVFIYSFNQRLSILM